MASHNVLGADGENLAVEWLIRNGYQILHRNWRYSYYEIDVIATKDDILRFVEVKCLHATPVNNPEDSVTKKKFKRLQRAADQYLFLHPGHRWVQYDVLAITLYPDKEPEYFMLEDVFL